MRWIVACFVLGSATLGCTCFNSSKEVTPAPPPATVDPVCYQNGANWEVACRKECDGRADESACDTSCSKSAQQLISRCPMVHASE